MSHNAGIRWIERSPSLYEARVTLPDGTDAYVGYVAVSPGEDAWRGYVGATFVRVGMGPRAVMQRVVAQRAAVALNARADGEEVAGHAL